MVCVGTYIFSMDLTAIAGYNPCIGSFSLRKGMVAYETASSGGSASGQKGE